MPKKLPFGLDPYYDIKYLFKDYEFETFFDVGANTGQSTGLIRKHFPDAEISCFEPVKKTFEILEKEIAGQQVKCFNIALGAENGIQEISIDPDNIKSTMNSLVNVKENYHSGWIHEKVKVQTLDDFCRSNAIDEIDYLKIDTEGYELEVLKGGINFLKNQAVTFIEAEVGMNPENKYHVAFAEVKQFLENFDYRLFGIYEQVHEWPTKKPVLRRVNAVFISKALHSK